MANTTQTTSDTTTVKLFEKEAWIATMQNTFIGDLFDNGAAFVERKFQGRDAKGDQITIDYVPRMTGVPIGEGGTLAGREKAIDKGYMQMTINETRDGVKFPNSGIEPQRTHLMFEQVAREIIPQRAQELMLGSIMNQLAGFNPTSFTSPTDGVTYASTADKLHVQGHNTPVAPSTNRIVRAGGAATDQALTSANTFTYALLDGALEKNAISLQPMKPLNDGFYRLYLSPPDFYNLKNDTTSPIQWGNIELSKISGGSTSSLEDRYLQGTNYRVFAGQYQNVLIFECRDIPYGVNASTSAVITTVRRNLLIGSKAFAFATPLGGAVNDDSVPLTIQTQIEDYGKNKGVAFEMLYGVKKMVATGAATSIEDNGVMVLSTYAATH